jgi:SH3-like domain-containing protein
MEEEAAEIDLPETPILSSRSEWAVVTTAYLRIRAEADTESEILGHLRRGAVAEIIGKNREKETVEGQEGSWCRIRSSGITGWIFGFYIEIYNSREKALNASKALAND